MILLWNLHILINHVVLEYLILCLIGNRVLLNEPISILCFNHWLPYPLNQMNIKSFIYFDKLDITFRALVNQFWICFLESPLSLLRISFSLCVGYGLSRWRLSQIFKIFTDLLEKFGILTYFLFLILVIFRAPLYSSSSCLSSSLSSPI